MRAVRLLVVMCAALVLPARASAQDTPTEAAQAFFDALMAQRWREAAELVTPESAARHQRVELDEIATLVLYQRQMWVVGADTLMPEEVGTALDTVPVLDLAEVAANSAHDSITVALLPGAGTIGELRALPATDFLARAWQATHRAFNPPDQDAAEPVLPTLVGEVMESDTAAFVVYRLAPPAPGPEQPTEEESVHLMHLRRVDGRWRVLLTSAFEPPLGVALSMEHGEADGFP